MRKFLRLKRLLAAVLSALMIAITLIPADLGLSASVALAETDSTVTDDSETDINDTADEIDSSDTDDSKTDIADVADETDSSETDDSKTDINDTSDDAESVSGETDNSAADSTDTILDVPEGEVRDSEAKSDSDVIAAPSFISVQSLTPGWNGSYTAPGSGVVATVVVASDATATTKDMIKSSQWSTDGTTWSADTLSLEAGGVYFIYTPVDAMSDESSAILPNIKASVTVNIDPAITTVGDYFLFEYAHDCKLLTSLNPPDTSNLTTVGDHFLQYYAQGAGGLTYLGVPDTSHITSTGTDFMWGYAMGCSSLLTLAAPDISGISQPNNDLLSNYASDCSSLTTLDVPDTSHITSVGRFFLGGYARNCKSLTTLDVPDTSNIVSVGSDFMENYAYGCTSLTTLDIPDTSNITTGSAYFMSGYANGCTSLTSLGAPDISGITSTGDNFMYGYAMGCTALTHLDAPVTSNLVSAGNWFLDSYALGCTSLKSLGIPDMTKLTSAHTSGSHESFMGYYAYNCSSLDYLLINSAPGFFASHNVNWQVSASAASDTGGLYAIVPSDQVSAWQALTASGKTLAINQITNTANVFALTSTPGTFTPTANDPVWGTPYLYGTVVTTWTNPSGTNGLLEALNKVGTYNANRPYVILIGADITMAATYALTSKNIVLRKTTETTVDPINHTGEKWWNYNNSWDTTEGDPTLFDGESDWKITVGSSIRHFSVGSGNINLTLENITLDGGVNVGATASPAKGGFQLVSGDVTRNFVFAGNVTRCYNSNTHYATGGGAVFETAGTKLASILDVRGGVFYNNSTAYVGGVIGSAWDSSNQTIYVRGYTIMQDNQALLYGGAIAAYQANLTVKDNAIIRDNTARGGGAILTKGGVMTITDNVRITGNVANYGIVSGDGDFRCGTGGGVMIAFQTGGVNGVFNLSGNALIDGNRASRSGGGIAMFDTNGDGTGITVNLTGGSITNNIATGETRSLPSSASASEKATIGSGGGVYCNWLTRVFIPAYSTTVFSGNQAAFIAFVDNGKLQNLSSDLHTGTNKIAFFDNDNYISHIEKSDIGTSLVNTHGPTGNDFFNLYNNYDCGVPNNIPVGLYSQVNVNEVPADGSGGDVTEDSANAYVDPLQIGVKQAEVGAKLKFTPVAEPGWYLKSFTAVTDPALSSTEMATAWPAPASGVYTLTVPGAETTLTATFHRKAVLSGTSVNFPQNFAGDAYNQPLAQNITITNTSPADGYSDDATSLAASLTGTNSSAFTLTTDTTTVAAGTSITTWTIRPKDKTYFPTANTYVATVHITYNDGANSGVVLDIPVSIDILNAGDLYLPGAESGNYDFGTTLLDGSDYEQTITERAITIASVGGENAQEATTVSLSLANQKKDGDTQGDYFLLSGDPISDIQGNPPESNDTAYRIAPAQGLSAGDYTADLVLTYTLNGSQITKTISDAVHFKVVTPATLSINSGNNIDFGLLNIGYAANALSFKNIAIQNTGGTIAAITKVELTGGETGNFALSGPAANGGATIGTVPSAIADNPGINANTWSLIPKQGLLGGTHSVTVTVTYKTGLSGEGKQTATATGTASFSVDGPPDVRWYTVASTSVYWFAPWGSPTTSPHLQNIPRSDKIYFGFDNPIDTTAGTVKLIPADGSATITLNISDGVWNAKNVNAFGGYGPGLQANSEGYIAYSDLKPTTTYTIEVTGLKDPVTGDHGGNTMTAVRSFSVKTEQPPLTGTVTVTGQTIYGNVLTADTGALSTDPAGTALGELLYIWKRNGNDLQNSNSPTHTIVAEDIGAQISVAVASRNAIGWIESAKTDTVTKRPITITATTNDKHYDGLNTAAIATATLSPKSDNTGLLPSDADGVSIVSGSGAFSAIGSADSDTTGLNVTYSGFDITGAKAGNYQLTGQPISVTADILKGFDAQADVHYAMPVADGGWKNNDYTILAKDGYLVSLSSAANGGWDTTLTLANAERAMGSATFYVKNVTTGEISRAETVNFGIDNTAPSLEIEIRENLFKTILNTITFGYFFKNSVDVKISATDDESPLGTGTDVNSGITKVKYLSYEGNVQSASWDSNNESLVINGTGEGTVNKPLTSFTDGTSFSIEPGWKGVVFAYVKDAAGNYKIVSSNGIVVYHDSSTSASVVYEKPSMTDKTFNISLNGNSIDHVYLFEGSNITVSAGANPLTVSGYKATLIADSDYMLSGGSITLKGDYLNTLDKGNYTLIVTIKPVGASFQAENGADSNTTGTDENDAPVNLSVPLTVNLSTPTVTWPSASQITYGAKLSEVTLNGGNASGGGSFNWAATPAPTTTYPTVQNSGYQLVFTPSADALSNYDYSLVTGWDSGTKTVTKTIAVTVTARKLTGVDVSATDSIPKTVNGFQAFAKNYDGTDSATVTFTPNNLVGNDTAASVVGSVTAHFSSGADSGNDKAVAIDAIQVLNTNYCAPDIPTSLKANINKISAGTAADIHKQAREHETATITADLSEALPSLPTGMSYGDVTYTVTGYTGDEILTSKPTGALSDASLTLNVKNTALEGQQAKIAFTVTTKNIIDFTSFLYIDIVGNVPLITAQPQAASVFVGDTLNLSVTAKSSEAMEVRWYSHGNPSSPKNPLTDWIAIGSGTQTATYAFNTSGFNATDVSCEIRNAQGTSVSQEVHVSVLDRYYTATASPTDIDFGSVTYGYDPIATQSITLTNTGNQTLNTGYQLASNSAFELVGVTGGTLSDLSKGGSLTVNVRPKKGLSGGTYNETLKLTWIDGGTDGTGTATAYASVALKFTVNAKAGVLSISDPDAAGSLTYNGIGVTPAILENASATDAGVALDTGVTWHYRVAGSTDNFIDGAPKAAGNWEVYATTAATANYQSAESNHVTFVIGKRSLNVVVTIADKDYDGKISANVSKALLDGLATTDTQGSEVVLKLGTLEFGSNGTPSDAGNTAGTFSSKGDANSDMVIGVVLSESFAISGPAAENYTLKQPISLTATIKAGFTPVLDTHYTKTTANENGWVNSAFAVTAKTGYMVGLSANAPAPDGDGTWVAAGTPLDLSALDTASGTGTFYVREVSTGKISKVVHVSFMKDATAPTGQITFRNNKFTSLLNTITFGFFFKNTVDVKITGNDATSGVDATKTQYYLSNTAIDLGSANWDGISWSNGESTSITPNFKGVVYARIFDKAGNSAVISSNGLVVYTDVSATTGLIDYTKTTKESKTFSVTPNGNTIDKVYLFEGSGVTLDDKYKTDADIVAANRYLLTLGPTDYTAGGTGESLSINLSAGFLDSLSAGDTVDDTFKEYTIVVTFKPYDTQFVAENVSDDNISGTDENDVPAKAYEVLVIEKLSITDEQIPSAVTDISASSIVYGNRLSSSAITATVKSPSDSGTAAQGTIIWADPTIIPGCDSVDSSGAKVVGGDTVSSSNGLNSAGYTFMAIWAPSEAADSYGTGKKASDYFAPIAFNATLNVTQAVPYMASGESPKGSSIEMSPFSTLADSKITGHVYYQFAGNIVDVTNPDGETAVNGTWYWDQNGDGKEYGYDGETQNPADTGYSPGAQSESVVFVPVDKRIARITSTASFTVFSPSTQIVIPDTYEIDGVLGTKLADIAGSATNALDNLLKGKLFKAIAVENGDEKAAATISGRFSWKNPDTLLSAAGGAQVAIIEFIPDKELTSGMTFDPDDPHYLRSETNVTVTLNKAAIAGGVALTGKAQYGQTLSVNTEDLLSSPDISGTVGLGDLTCVWRRYISDSDSEGEIIAGASGLTYTLTGADIGKKIGVTVSAANVTGSKAAGKSDTVKPGDQAPPAAPVLSSKTSASITVEAIQGAQYSIDYGSAGNNAHWQDSNVFTREYLNNDATNDALKPDTTYSIYARMKATDVLAASPAGTPLAVRTNKAVSFTVSQIGGTSDGKNTTTSLQITFSEAIAGLKLSNIILTGNGITIAEGTLSADSSNTQWAFNISGSFTHNSKATLSVNGIADADMLSADVEVTLYRDITGPSLSEGGVNRASDTNATIGFTTDEAGEAFYYVVSEGVQAPLAQTIANGGTSLGAVSGTVNDKSVSLSAGARDIYIVVKDASGNIGAPLKIEAAATKAKLVNAPEIITGLIYNGSEQNIVETGKASGGTMEYAVVSAVGAPPADDAYSSDIPKATNAGNYDVYYRVKGDINHQTATDATWKISVTISKTDAHFTTNPKDAKAIYTGSLVELINTGATSDGTFVYYLSSTYDEVGDDGYIAEGITPSNPSLPVDAPFTVDIPSAKNAGIYTLWYKVKGDGNHNDTEPVKMTAVLQKAQQEDLVITDTLPDKAGTEATITVTGGSGSGAYSLVSSDESVAKVTAIDTAAGTFKIKILAAFKDYKLTFGRASDNNYLEKSDTSELVTTLQFEARDVTVTKGSVPEVKYNEKVMTSDISNAQGFTFTGSDGVSVSGTLSWKNPQTVVTGDKAAGGQFTATAVFTPDDSYKGLYKNLEFDVNLKVTASDKTRSDIADAINNKDADIYHRIQDEDESADKHDGLHPDDYPAGALDSFIKDYNDAQTVLNNPEATENEVKDALDKLNKAETSLIPDHTLMKTKIHGNVITGKAVLTQPVIADLSFEVKGHLPHVTKVTISGASHPSETTIWESGSGTNLYDPLLKLTVGTLTEGSAVIDILPEYLAKLLPGEHTINITFVDALNTDTTSMTFTIKASANGGNNSNSSDNGNKNSGSSKTGGNTGYVAADTADPGTPSAWAILVALSLLEIAFAMAYKRSLRRRN
jgi:hypothetical protein